jgi:hypothetical protein
MSSHLIFLSLDLAGNRKNCNHANHGMVSEVSFQQHLSDAMRYHSEQFSLGHQNNLQHMQ